MKRGLSALLLSGTASLMFMGCKSVPDERALEKEKISAELETLRNGTLYERVMYLHIKSLFNEQYQDKEQRSEPKMYEVHLW